MKTLTITLALALAAPALARDITLAWRTGRRLPPAAAAFLELARATYADAAEPGAESVA